jgi:hypothetical protein
LQECVPTRCRRSIHSRTLMGHPARCSALLFTTSRQFFCVCCLGSHDGHIPSESAGDGTDSRSPSRRPHSRPQVRCDSSQTRFPDSPGGLETMHAVDRPRRCRDSTARSGHSREIRPTGLHVHACTDAGRPLKCPVLPRFAPRRKCL